MYSSGFIEPHAKKGEFYLGTPDFKKTFLRVLKRSGGWFIGVSVVQGLVSAETRPCATWRSRRLCARGRGRAQVTSACASAALGQLPATTQVSPGGGGCPSQTCAPFPPLVRAGSHTSVTLPASRQTRGSSLHSYFTLDSVFHFLIIISGKSHRAFQSL